MSWALSSCSNRGLSGPVVPTTASATWPPGIACGLGSAGIAPLQAVSRNRAASPKAFPPGPRGTSVAAGVGVEPDVCDGRHEEDGCEHPGRVEDLPLEAPPSAIAAAQPAVATADGPPQARRLWRLE